MNRIWRHAAVAALGLSLAACGRAGTDRATTVGFAQIGSESGWRAAETKLAISAAQARGITLKVADGQQRQENQIKAIRSFIAQGVGAIFLAPVVSTGWDDVLAEAKAAKIPVVLLDRQITTQDPSLFLTAVAADNVHEGQVAGEWLVGKVGAKPCRVVELQGTVGSTLVADRKKGFDQAIAKTPDIKIVRTQSGEFTRAKGKEVMEGFIKAENAAGICAVYAHNDDMMIGAIQAMKAAGLKPGTEILTVSIDGVPDIFKAMADGEANATVELAPDMAARGFDVLAAYQKDGKAPPKFVQTPSKLYLPDTAAAEYARRKDLY
ncbi:MAG: sugar transporter substrate-binding protein [Caulobacter sp.]|nr:sugar transporter substrate-binding protein [Caulobacter sp.]